MNSWINWVKGIPSSFTLSLTESPLHLNSIFVPSLNLISNAYWQSVNQ